MKQRHLLQNIKIHKVAIGKTIITTIILAFHKNLKLFSIFIIIRNV